MFNRRAMTLVVLIAIPVALFSLLHMEDGIVRNMTNLTAAVLILFAWDVIAKQKISRIDVLLGRTYLAGLFLFSLWLGLNSIVVSTYESSWHSSRDAAFHTACLRVEPFLVGCGAAVFMLFAILCIVRIFIAIRDRRAGSLKASHV